MKFQFGRLVKVQVDKKTNRKGDKDQNNRQVTVRKPNKLADPRPFRQVDRRQNKQTYYDKTVGQSESQKTARMKTK